MSDALAPGLLIAVPQLLDPNFQRSVVFLLEHGSDGALGVVINRPSNLRLGELFRKLGIGYGGDPDTKVLVGGPVHPESGMVIHAEGNETGDSHPLTGSIFVCRTSSSLGRLFENKVPRALFCLGYAGWGPGQLEREIETGSWVPAPADDDLIFDADREALWDRAFRDLGIDPRVLVSGDSDSEAN